MLLFHDWAALVAWIGTGIGYGGTYAWEIAYLGNIYPPCGVDRLLCRNEWPIKGLGVMMTTGGEDVIRFLRGTCRHVTSVGVVFAGTLMILVIGLLDCVGGPSERYDWLDRLSWGAWLAINRHGPSNRHVQRCGCLPRGSQDCVYKERAGREIFNCCCASDWATSRLCSYIFPRRVLYC